MPESPTPVPAEGPDPIDSSDPSALRPEILRLRDALLGEQARTEVLRDRVTELEAHVEALAADNETLHAELARNPLMRVVRAVGRRLGGRR